jgi:hypothetical protein
MKNDMVELLIQDGTCCLKREGEYIFVEDCRNEEEPKTHKINISLFYKIALFTSERRSYKTVIRKFFDELQEENIPSFFATRESLENATQACGKPGGRIAFLLGLFCRYYGKLPRNVNVVLQLCEECSNTTLCGRQQKCGDFYGCGNGVSVPLDPRSFKLSDIPQIRADIKTESFPNPINEE